MSAPSESDHAASGLRLGVGRPIRTIDEMVEWGMLAEDIGFSLVASGDSQTM